MWIQLEPMVIILQRGPPENSFLRWELLGLSFSFHFEVSRRCSASGLLLFIQASPLRKKKEKQKKSFFTCVSKRGFPSSCLTCIRWVHGSTLPRELITWNFFFTFWRGMLGEMAPGRVGRGRRKSILNSLLLFPEEKKKVLIYDAWVSLLRT